MKKWDKIIIISILTVAVFCFAVWLFFGKDGSRVIISQNNEVVFEGSLFVENTVSLEGNTVVIKNKEVKMQSANCKNQICVKHEKIGKKGQSIICLPNKVIVEIK